MAAQLEQARTTVAELQAAHADQVAEFEAELGRIRTEAAEQVRALQGELAELRPAAEQAAMLGRQLETLQAGQAGRNGSSRSNGASGSGGSAEPVPGQRRESRAPAGTPTASAATSGSSALALNPAMTAKESLFAVWDGLRSEGTVSADTPTPTLVTLGLKVVEVDLGRDSVSRYAREWVRQVRAGQRGEATTPRLRAVRSPN